VAGSCEHDNEPSGSVKDGRFFDQLADCEHPKKVSGQCSLVV
jgi:hypothetical protein